MGIVIVITLLFLVLLAGLFGGIYYFCGLASEFIEDFSAT